MSGRLETALKEVSREVFQVLRQLLGGQALLQRAVHEDFLARKGLARAFEALLQCRGALRSSSPAVAVGVCRIPS